MAVFRVERNKGYTVMSVSAHKEWQKAAQRMAKKVSLKIA